MRIENLDDLGKMRQAAGETIHLIDDDDVDFARFYISKQLLERGRSMLPPE